MLRKVYRIENFVEDSFDKTMKVLINHVSSDFNMEKIIYKESFVSPDSIQIGSDLQDMSKPKYVYVTFNYLSEGSWTNIGGHEFCNIVLKDNSKILVNWDVSSYSKTITEIDIKLLRKIKLEKLEKK